MTITIPDLWSDDIRVDVLTPLAILRVQQERLRAKTHGIVEADLRVRKELPTKTILLFSLVAPALENYSERVLVVAHALDLAYPAIVTSPAFELQATRLPSGLSPGTAEEQAHSRVAATEEEFIDLVRTAFRSPYIRSRIQALIAHSNEAKEPLPNDIPVEIVEETNEQQSP